MHRDSAIAAAIQFMLIFLTVYVSANYYVYSWFQRAFGWRFFSVQTLIFILFIASLPVIERSLHRSSWQLTASIVAIPAYVWILCLLWFFFGGLIADLWNLAIRLASLALKRPLPLQIPARMLLLVLAVWSALAIAWGLTEVRRLRVTNIALSTPKFPAGTQPVRIMQVTDLHLSSMTSAPRLDRVMRAIHDSNPDMLVLTGDMLDFTGPQAASLMAQFKPVIPPLGKYAVLGNHEFYTGSEACAVLIQDAGFKLLRAESVRVPPAGGLSNLVVAGVDDPLRFANNGAYTSEDAALPRGVTGDYVIFLKHQPLVSEKAQGRFDLQISGHTHAGQIFPFRFVVGLFYKYMSGLYSLPSGGSLYVSSGAGTWGPPVRVFAPPDVTIISIGPAQ
ncbi:MAG: hypothetical protein C0404_09975 [Verrucomicrobia bacterium]|nr:hypothetical protein [Verrucomicrobiota bacterium]